MSPINEVSAAQALAHWAQTADQSAIECAVSFAAPLAHAQAVRMLGSASDADDVTQEALLQLMRSANRYDPSRPFRAWIAHLTFAAVQRFLRSGRTRRQYEGGFAAETFREEQTEVAMPDANLVLLRQALTRLGERDQEAITLYYYSGLSTEDCAKALKLSENAFCVRLHRARERLRKLLPKEMDAAGVVLGLEAVIKMPIPSLSPTICAKTLALSKGTLPVTTLATTTHALTWPLMIGGAALAIGTGAGLAFLQKPEEAPPIIVQIPKQETRTEVSATQPAVWFQGRAGEALKSIDGSSALVLTIDIEGLKKHQPGIKPFTLLEEPGAASLAKAFQQTPFFQMASDEQAKPFDEILFHQGLCQGLAVSLDDSAQQAGKRIEERVRMAFALSVKDPQDWMGGEGKKILGGFHSQDREAFSSRPWGIIANWSPNNIRQQVPQPQSPVEVRLNFSSLLSAYVQADAEIPGIVRLLGPNWKRASPKASLRVDPDEQGVLQGRWEVTGTVPLFTQFIPMLPELPSQVADWEKNLVIRPGRILSAPCNLPTTEDELGRISVATDLDPASSDPLVKILSGDACLTIRSAAPLPRFSLVLGLKPSVDPIATLGPVLRRLGAFKTDTGWRLPIAMGLINARIWTEDGRICLDTAPEGTLPLGSKAGPECLAADLDLPKLSTVMYPWLVMAANASKQGELLPSAELLAKHLPPYRLRWTPTKDGAVIQESGVPFLSLMSLVVGGKTLAETKVDSESIKVLKVIQKHRKALAALRPLAEELGKINEEILKEYFIAEKSGNKIMYNFKKSPAEGGVNTVALEQERKQKAFQNIFWNLPAFQSLFDGQTPTLADLQKRIRIPKGPFCRKSAEGFIEPVMVSGQDFNSLPHVLTTNSLDLILPLDSGVYACVGMGTLVITTSVPGPETERFDTSTTN